MTINQFTSLTECIVETGPMSSQAQSLLLIRLAMFTVASLAICRADPKADENGPVLPETENAPTVRHSDWRKAFHADFKYIPRTAANPAIAPEATLEKPASSDIVVLPKFVVRDAAPNYRELEKAMRSQSQVTENVMVKRLGIGKHVVNFRHFSVGCYTIFFIPVAGGISW